MGDIALSAAVRDSLLSLQGTTNLIERTQGRLSSGLKVAGPVDDPVSFFQSKGLNDRAFDFNEKKDGIDQGISTLTAALDGVDAIESLVRQLKGVAQSIKSAEDSQLEDLVSQFNDLRDQINNLAADTSYQGINLVNGTGVVLDIEFSEKTASQLTIDSVDLTVDDTSGGLNIQSVVGYSGDIVANHAAVNGTEDLSFSDVGLSAGTTIHATWQGPNQTYSTADTANFEVDGATFTVNFGTSATYTAGTTFELTVTTAFTTASGPQIIGNTSIGNNFSFCADYTTGLKINGDSASNALSAFSTGTVSAGSVALLDTADTFTFTNRGDSFTLTTADDAGKTFTIDGVEFTLHVGKGATANNISAGDTFTVNLVASDTAIASGTNYALVACAAHVQNATAITAGAGGSAGRFYFRSEAVGSGNTNGGATAVGYISSAGVTVESTFSASTAGLIGVAATTTATSIDTDAVTTAAQGLDYVRAGDTVLANAVIDDLDEALRTLRTESQNLGTNVAVLSTRLDFTETYVNTLESGAGKLTLADINEEGANLLALQTRQQLGVQSLSFAGQAEQQVLSLFR